MTVHNDETVRIFMGKDANGVCPQAPQAQCGVILRNPQMAMSMKDLKGNSGKRFKKINTRWNFQ